MSQILAGSGHPPAHLTNLDAPFAWSDATQIGNIPPIPTPATVPVEIVIVADATARGLLAPTQLNQMLIQTVDPTNGARSLWIPTGLLAGNWQLKVAGMAAQNQGAVAITGGNITGITDLFISDGGTGASTAAGAVYNLSNPTVAPIASAINWALSNNVAETISANTVYTFAGETNGASITVAVINTGAYTVAFPAAVQWTGGTAPVATVSSTDVFTFIRVGGVTYGSVIQDFS